VVADDYHCGGYATPSVMAPLGALALGATVYAITHTVRLRRAGHQATPANRVGRAFAVVGYLLGLTAVSSAVLVADTFCNT
jgi:hypothetical protein